MLDEAGRTRTAPKLTLSATALLSRGDPIEPDHHVARRSRRLVPRLVHWSALQRLAATLGSSVVVLLFAGLVYYGLGRQAAGRAAVAHTHRVIEAVELVLARLTDAETGQRGYLLTGRERYLEPYALAEQDAVRGIAALRLLTEDNPAQLARLDTLAALARAKFAELDTTLTLERTAGHAAALALLDSDRGKRIMDSARGVAASMERSETELLAAHTAREVRIATRVRWTLVAGSLLAVAMALLINTLLARDAAAQERSARELDAQNSRLEEQALELELQNRQLQEQAVEVETQQQHLQEQAAELETQTEELSATNHALEEAVEALRIDEERLRLALRAGRLGAWEWDLRENAVVWSPELERIHGLEPGTFEGTLDAYRRHLHPDDRERVLQATASAVERRAPHYLLHRIVRTDGEVRWIEAHGRFVIDSAGSPVRLVGTCVDVTDRQRAEDDLRFIVQASEVLASSLDYETTLAAVARLAVPTLADWCAVDIVEPAGTLVRLAVEHPDPEKVAMARELQTRYPGDPNAPLGRYNVLRTGVAESMSEIPGELVAAAACDPEQLRMIRALGLRSYMAVPLAARGSVLGVLSFVSAESGRRYTSSDVALAGHLAHRAALAIESSRLFTDITESRRAAEAANAAKSEFLATMSHELRTPLNAISGYVDLLAMELRGPVTDAQREDLTRIKKNGQHLLALINDILNLSRIEAGRLDLDLTDVALADVLENVEAFMAPQMREKGLTYACARGGAGLAVRADAEKLQQILLNLLTNACKFTAPGGEVVIEYHAIQTIPARDDEAPREPDGARPILVRVRDSGRGIPADKLASIFEPFVQIDRHSTHESQQGVGLGLAISRDLARAMGGELIAESVVGEGSTFDLTLPGVGPGMAAPAGRRLAGDRPDTAGETRV